MEDTATTPSCNMCGKTGTATTTLKNCAKCRVTMYCSRECQKQDWKTHKKNCAQNAASNSNVPSNSNSNGQSGRANSAAPQLKNLDTQVPNPFTRLDKHTYLHDRTEKDVFKLLIDCFRMRQEDNYTLEGDIDTDSIYDGKPSSLPGFRKFIRLAASRPNLLPPWWNASKQTECETFGLTGGNWSSLKAAVEKGDIIEHYGDMRMPMQLRMLGETVYGRDPGGQPGDSMRKMMAAMESGKGPAHSSFINMAGMA